MSTEPMSDKALITRLGLAAASLALAAALVVGFRSPASLTRSTSSTGGSSGGTPGGSSGGTSGSTAGGASGGSSSGGSSSGGSSSGSSSGGSATAGSATVDGSEIETRYGPVEVEITVANGRITAVTAIELPSGGRSGRISSYAAPVLSSEAMAAQSASIDGVSGATYTSEAYAQSLQAAIDQAGL
jgi:uncharacterized protein with FMN-binding domain